MTQSTIPDPVPPPEISSAARWTGRIMSALPVLLLLFSASMKLVKPPGLEDGFNHLGYPVRLATGLGLVELACTVVYLVPRTAVLGAILLTGYLGGAITSHLRIGESWIMALGLGVLVWGGLYLRDTRLRALIPFRQAR